jgi:hypothetical protein
MIKELNLPRTSSGISNIEIYLVFGACDLELKGPPFSIPTYGFINDLN